MFRSILLKSLTVGKDLYCRTSCSISKKYKIAIIGATGNVGQPLALLLKLNPVISELRLHDIQNTPGIAADLSHIETATKVTHSEGKDIATALKGTVDVIICSAGTPRKPDTKREDLFDINAQIAFDVAKSMAQHSPEAILLLVTNPVNSLVPVVCEVLKNAGKFNKNKIIGVTTLDSVRAATFIGELSCIDPKNINVPVIGGHSAPTIIPLLSRSNPSLCIDDEKQQQLIKRIQDAGAEIIKAKAGNGSASLSMSYATSRLTYSILRALNGESNIIECGYVSSDEISDIGYLATPILLGKCGIEKNLGIGSMNEYEKKLFCGSLEQLKKDIALGIKYANEKLTKKTDEKLTKKTDEKLPKKSDAKLPKKTDEKK